MDLRRSGAGSGGGEVTTFLVEYTHYLSFEDTFSTTPLLRKEGEDGGDGRE